MDTPGDLPQDDWPRIPHRGHYTREKCRERLDWLRAQTETPLEALGTYDLDPEQLEGNVENFVGVASVPVGVAGPLLVYGDHVKGLVYAPFATTEGALVASATRGAQALSRAGGVRVRVVHQQMIRAPLFVLDTMEDAFRMKAWLEAHHAEIEAEVRRWSRYAELAALRCHVVGNTLHARFVYRTGDAAGQNMTTTCTWKACQWILAHVTGVAVRHFTVEANLSSDKKVSFLSYVEGRGTRVVAEVFVPEDILSRVLKVSSAQLVETTHAFMAGALQAGMVGFNVNVANAVAALFVATGQDVASVHESSVGQLDVRQAAGGVYASLVLPSLVVGTVGGGTGLPTQRECLELMGCYGAGRAARLAEIVAAYCLALDLSTLCAITGGQFATAHERLGRNRPEDGLRESHLTTTFFERALAPKRKGAPARRVVSVEPFTLDASASILSSLTSAGLKKKVGHFPFHVVLKTETETDAGPATVDVVVKAKPTDDEVIGMLNTMAQACGNELGVQFEAHKYHTGFRHCHVRELAVCALDDPRFTAVAPLYYHTWRDDRHEIYVLVMEYLDGLSHLNTEDQPSAWRDEHVRAVLHDLATFHSLYYERTTALEAEPWMDRPTAERTARMAPLWHALVDHHAHEFAALYPPARAALVRRLIDRIPDFWPLLEQAPRTLIHNDFNPRNLGLRPLPDGGWRLCAYDWELATVHVPQHDVAEFLAFVLPPDITPEDRLAWVDVYRRALEDAAAVRLDPADFARVFDLASFDLLLNRMGLYTMAHTFKHYAFLPRVLDGLFRYAAARFAGGF